MIDCGATALFLDHDFVTRNHITTFPLKHPIELYNIDGTPNSAGRITHFARLRLSVDSLDEWTDFLVTDLGGEDVILGLPWLRDVNPAIDWKDGLLRIPSPPRRTVTIEEIPEEPLPYQYPTMDGRLLEQIENDPATLSSTSTTQPQSACPPSPSEPAARDSPSLDTLPDPSPTTPE